MNRYPLWKYLLIVVVVAMGLFYAAPNLYAPDPAVQISGQSSVAIDETLLAQATQALDAAGITYSSVEPGERSGLIRLHERKQQLAAKTAIQQALGFDYVVALNLAATTPAWLADAGGQPMKLGLDLSGGVHFLMEVDTAQVVVAYLESRISEFKDALRKDKARYKTLDIADGAVVATFIKAELREKAEIIARQREFNDFLLSTSERGGRFVLTLTPTEGAIREREEYAVTQNLTTLRNRVNELGVSEPIVQRQGRNRIVVELPGVQDTAEAKRIIGKTANLEFRLEAESNTVIGREQFEFRSEGSRERTAWLEKKIVIAGDNVTNAGAGFDENGGSQVNITLDGRGGRDMHNATKNNVGRRLGVLFVETKQRTEERRDADGVMKKVPVSYQEKNIISLATIQSALGVQFRVTGLDDPQEASDFALLLRAGALAAPMTFVEERTIGPSLGAENINLGIKSVQLGMLLVLVFMLVYYRVFGLFANLALALNLVVLVAVMSILGATLTLPGIAGIVLTVGMAVDANVLIFSRIREELKNGETPQGAIHSGYERAIVSIFDANVTTLIVAVILYTVGTGPIKGFAVTLSIGIVTSMFTAIMVTRALANLVYGARTVDKLHI
ncbi:MAG: protein translocase subunit SecD [Porticoccaceae bacterium]